MLAGLEVPGIQDQKLILLCTIPHVTQIPTK